MFLRRCVYGLCITVTMLIIFGFSSQPAEVTRRTSNIIVTPIENVLKQSLYDDTNEAKEWKEIKKIIVKIVRKSAHFFLYFLLSIFVFLYIENSRISRNLNFYFPVYLLLCMHILTNFIKLLCWEERAEYQMCLLMLLELF